MYTWTQDPAGFPAAEYGFGFDLTIRTGNCALLMYYTCYFWHQWGLFKFWLYIVAFDNISVSGWGVSDPSTAI